MGEHFIPTAMLHGFIRLDDNNNPSPTGENQEHCDYDSGECDGWNVWLRRDYPNRGPDAQEPFDSDDTRDRDFDSFDDAYAYARGLAAEFQCELDLY